jgi:hypothetical protein
MSACLPELSQSESFPPKDPPGACDVFNWVMSLPAIASSKVTA